MVKAMGVRFQPWGRLYTLPTGSLEVMPGMVVAVAGASGVRLGKVLWGPREVEEAAVDPDLVLRLPTAEDRQHSREFDAWANSCLTQAQESASQQGLIMKLWRVEPDLDRKRFAIYFSAPARVDFRGLVRELSSRWKTKVEFHQLGARDESKVLGTLGLCGQPACCARFLGQFPAISLRMAREQNLAPNPEKLSGLCGRLFCCLGYELGHYQEAAKKLPRPGQRVSTPSGPALVTARNLMKETVTVSLEDGQATMELPLSQISQL